MKEGEAGRGRAWSKRREGGMQGDKGKTGRGSRSGRKDGREGDTNAQCQAWLCTEACEWLLAITLYLHVGGRD